MRDWPGESRLPWSAEYRLDKHHSFKVSLKLYIHRPQSGPTFSALFCLLRNLLRPLVTPKRSHGKRYPTENKTKPAYRRNRTQPASTAEYHQVKAAGEYEYSNHKQPTRRIDPITWPTSRCPANGEQRQGMVHMITNADFKNRQEVFGYPRLQGMCTESTKRYTDRRSYCSNRKPI